MAVYRVHDTQNNSYYYSEGSKIMIIIDKLIKILTLKKQMHGQVVKNPNVISLLPNFLDIFI